MKSTLSNLSDFKVWCKIRILKFLTKNALFGYFWVGIWKKYCHIRNQHPRIYQIAKLRGKKMPKFGIKNALFGYFWARILKNYCHIWNQHLQICLQWVFNSYSEFWYSVCFFYRSGVLLKTFFFKKHLQWLFWTLFLITPKKWCVLVNTNLMENQPWS